MQMVSDAYIQSIKQPFRNREYIKVSIGVVNSDAQNNAEVKTSESPVAYFSNIKKPFDGFGVGRVYATAEQDFAKVDGSMYFLPREEEGYDLYNNGIVSRDLLGKIYISFNGMVGLDIKGLTIDFGEYYPTNFTVETEAGIRSYENRKSLFVTEDSFDGTSYFIITPITMVNGQGRFRIHQMTFGIANTFSNEKVISCSVKEYVSPTSETIPSTDTTIVVDNQDLYYSVDNPESAIAYMEIGQEMKTSFGYDVTGNGDIEWLPEKITYLQSWSADDVRAEFTATDRFYQLDEIFYGGLYRTNGISLYDLAIEVLNSAGIEDEREYFVDPYLKKIIVYNPVPAVKHSEALQIIANAGRCTLYEDRQNKIHLKASFVPDMTAESNDKTRFSSLKNLLKDNPKSAYAMASNDFSVVDGSLFFMPEDGRYKEVGYVSESLWVQPEEGTATRRLGFRLGTKEIFPNASGYWSRGENPKIVITLEASFVAFGILINFRNVAPEEFVIRTYLSEVLVDAMTVENPNLEYISDKQFREFDKMVIEFTKGYPNARVTVDNILIGDVTNYTLTRERELEGTPKGTRQDKIRNITIVKTNYRESQEGFRELLTEKITLSKDSEHAVYFTYPSYGIQAEVKNNDKIKVDVLDSSNYYARLSITGIAQSTEIELAVSGYEYVADETYYKVNHNPNGQEMKWSNPLVSTNELAKDLEEWLASYYLGDVDYEIPWRGDPRVEANDLFYLELKDRDKALIRSYQNDLEYNGAWKGNLKARKVVMAWQ